MDIKNWKEFKVGDLFDVHQLERVTDKGGYVPDRDIIDINGQYPYLAAVSINNGVKGYTNIKPNNEGNCITLSTTADSPNTIFYQPEPFVGRQQMAGIYKSDVSQMSKNIALFIISILKKQLILFNYSNKLTFEALCDIKLSLPTKDDKPDFDYMEDFIKNRENVVKEKIENFKNIKERKSKIDTQEWGEFKVGDLFEIKPTKNHGRANKDLFDDFGTTPVVVNSSYDNGIGGMTDLKPTEKAPKITFSDTTNAESIFLQISDFAGYSHIQGLNPIKYESQWNEKTLLYFCTVFKTKALTISYSYVNKFTRISAESLNIKLPIKNNEPDWEYMEDYINKKQKEVREKLELLRR